MKNLIANIPIVIGNLIAVTGEYLIKIGINLHIKLGTKKGSEYKQLEQAILVMKEMVQPNRDDNAAIFLKTKN